MNIQDFLQFINENPDLAQKMNGAANPDEAYAIAKEAGLTDSFEVFTDTMAKIYKAQSELSDEDIDSIVGGVEPVISVVSVVTASTMATIAGVAAV